MNQIQTENIPKIQIDFETSQFDEFFLEAIDQTFSTLLGNNAKQVVFSFLDKKYKLTKEDLPNRIGDFIIGLEQVFGRSAPLIELEMMKNLKKSVPSFNYVVERSDFSFEQYAESLKHQMANF